MNTRKLCSNCIPRRWGTKITFMLLFYMMPFLAIGIGHTDKKNERSVCVLNCSDTELNIVFKEITRQLHYSFVYNNDEINDHDKITLKISSNDIDAILNKCFSTLDVAYQIKDKAIILYRKTRTTADETIEKYVELKGVVTDKSNSPLPGATIRLKSTLLGASTDSEGRFDLKVPEASQYVLQISFVGMKSKEITLNGSNIGKPLTIILEASNESLNEVVVTGMFNRKKEGFTGSASTITGEEIKRLSTTNITKVLTILDPSLRIMEDNLKGSNPNNLPDIRMRGQATLNTKTGTSSNDVVMLQGEYDSYPNKPLIILDGFEVNLQTLVDLDPDRVSTITLLKDAAATAIYGSKAANGVIVIESKAPKDGKLWVSYGGNLRFEIPDLSSYNLMNASEKLEIERLAGFYEDNGSIEGLELYQEKLREVKRGVNTYWLDKPLRTAVQQRHTITLEGGDRSLRYRLYAGVNFTPGVMKESERQTTTGAMDLQYRFKKVLLKNSVDVTNTKGDESSWGSFSEYAKLNPYLRPYGENGEIMKHLDHFSGAFRGVGGELNYANPMYNTTFHSKNRTTSFTIRNIFKIEYNPTDAIRLEGSFSLSKGYGNTDVFRPAQHTAFDKILDPSLKGDYSRRQRDDFSYSMDLTASYNKLLKSVHYVTANLRMSVQENQNSNYGAYVTGFPNDNMDDILFGKKYNEKMTGSEGTSRSIGGIGSFGYSYDFRYSIDFNIRVDGSSQFGKDNRFAPFWSTGLRWDVKKESFLKDFTPISYLTLRASYGVTGTQGFAPYQAQELYSYSNLLVPYIGSPGTGVELVGMPNNKLKWQQTDNWNAGITIGFLNDRITLNTDVYRKITKNSLTDITLAPSAGFGSYSENLGELENKGIEFNATFIPYRNNEQQAYWTITLNGSHNTDKLKKILEAMKLQNDINDANTTSKPLPRYVEGESLNRLWVVKSLGIDPATGMEIFQKRDGRMTSEWDAVDMIPVGTTEPKLQGNVLTSFSYKGFGMDLSFNYRYGGKIYNSTLVDKIENCDLMYNADKRALELRWKKSGDIAKYRAISSSEQGMQTKASSRFVMNERTLSMSSLSFSYRIDANTSKFLKHYGMSSFKIGFNMEDLFYLSSVKRERGLDYPFARQMGVVLNIGF